MTPHRTIQAFLALYIVCSSAIEQPPRESKPPTLGHNTQDIIYFTSNEKERIDLPCQAIGSQPIHFEWTKNDEVLDIEDPVYISETTNRSRIISVSQKTGSITITEPVKEDEGFYQCSAVNKYGKSLSKKIQLVKATIGIFSEEDKERKMYPKYEGMHLEVKCNPPKSHPPAKTKWVKYKNGETDYESVKINDRIAIDDEGNLWFANIQQQDANFNEKYACMTHIVELNVFSQGAFSYIQVQKGNPNLTVPADLLYYSKPDTVIGLKGKYVSFKCIFGGNPTPVTKWKRIGGEMDNMRMQVEPHQLTIRSIRYEDAGKYQCIGSNSVISQAQTHTFTLQVESEPEWLSEPQPVNAGVEETAEFRCVAEGEPTPNIEWFINGEPLENPPKNPRQSMVDGVLTFTDLSLEKNDPQVIQCNASNLHGYKWADVALSIQAYKPEIKVPLTEMRVAAERDIVLPCDTDAKPTATIYWKRGDQKLSGSRYIIHPSGNLTIKNIDMDDSGTYTCIARNKYGRTTATGELDVRKKTTIYNPPLPSQFLKFGKRVLLTCSANADAQEDVTITWLKDGEPVDLNDPRYSLTTEYYLSIENVNSSDTGNYTCVASTSLDSATVNAELKIIAPPDPPYEVGFKTCLARSVVVTWKPGRNNFSPITHYIVQYNHSYEPDIWHKGTTVSDPNQTQVNIVISPYANYTFRVIAVNRLGESFPSERSRGECMANGAPPDKHPDNVRTIRNKPGWLIVTWDRMPEIEHNAEGFRYVLSTKRNGKTNTTEINDWTDNRREFNYGLIYEQFEVYVEAFNNEGTFREGAVIHIGYTGEGEPLVYPKNFELQPDREVTATTAYFQWDPVDTSPQAMRGEFHGYKIVFWHEDNPNITNVVLIEETSSRKKRAENNLVTKVKGQVNNLPPYSNLLLQVFARNTFYESNGSNIINVTTPEGVPGPVSYGRILLRGAHHFLLEWGQPENPNGILTGYEVGYKGIDRMILGELQEAARFDDPDRSRAYIGGLEENKGYRVYIWALTSKGRGQHYIVDGKTARPGPLAIPTVNLEYIGENYVNVTWSTSPKSDNPAGSVHYVKYRKVGETEWKESERERLHSWLNVSNLTSATRYEIRVVATIGHNSNEHGEQPSPIIPFTTRGTRIGVVKEETSIAQSSWFIGMMVALLVLIIILIVVCILKRNRGEKYHVQERERLRGTDPEAHGPDHFNEYPKSAETDPLAGSPDSFDNDLEKGGGGSETDSMAEYGDVDPSKFNEDGSFIGQYGNQKPSEPNAPSAMSTFV